MALLGVVLFTGCAKDEPEYEDDDVITLFAEGYTSNNSSKLAVQGAKTYWVDGEKIWVNGATYQVTVKYPSGEDSAKAARPSPNPDNYNRKFKRFIC